MNKHYIEKPKRPACLLPQNIGLVVITIIILTFFDPMFLIIFCVAMVVFYIYDIYNFKHMPEAVLYIRDGQLHYFKKSLTSMDLHEIFNVRVSKDNKNNSYIQIDYRKDNADHQITIKDTNAENIVDDLNRILKKLERKEEKAKKEEK